METTKWKDLQEVEVRPGIFRRAYTKGDLQMLVYRYAPGSVFETHSHPEQQLTIGLEGMLDFTIGTSSREFGPGCFIHIPGRMPHSAVNNGPDDALTINIYTPPKKGI